MKKWFFGLLTVLSMLIALPVSPAVAQDSETIAETLLTRTEDDNPEFALLSELVSARPAAAEALSNPESSYTLFAPTDAAIQAFLDERDLTLTELKSQADFLNRVLLYHVAEGAYTAEDLALLEGDYLPTLLINDDVRITTGDGQIAVDDATVTQPDILAENGVIHAVDTVIVPDGTENPSAELPTISDYILEQATAADDRNFSVFLLALTEADPGFFERLRDPGEGLTLFLPTDEAFADLLERLDLDRREAFSNEAFLNETLAYHLLDDILLFEDILVQERLTPVLESSAISVRQNGENTTLNNIAQFIVADVPVSNGVIHVIDSVLLPSDSGINGIDDTDDTPRTSIADVLQGYTLQERSPEFVVLLEALDQTGLLDDLENTDANLTLLAPTDAAFAEVGITVENVDAQLDETRDLLLYHLIGEPLLADDLRERETVTSLRGDDITVTSRQRLEFNNGAQVIIGNIEASNGVIHMVDDVLPAPANATTTDDDN
jgi:transforming growth factor-beta-induced protein